MRASRATSSALRPNDCRIAIIFSLVIIARSRPRNLTKPGIFDGPQQKSLPQSRSALRQSTIRDRREPSAGRLQVHAFARLQVSSGRCVAPRVSNDLGHPLDLMVPMGIFRLLPANWPSETRSLHAGKLGPVQINRWLPTSHVWGMAINMDLGLSACDRSKDRSVLPVQGCHAFLQ